MFRFSCSLVLFSSLVLCGFASGQERSASRKDKTVPLAATARSDTAKALPAEGVAFFEKKIRPVLVAECYKCHSTESGKKVRGGLALDTGEGTRRGGDTGPVIVPGNPSRSLLIKALSHSDPELSMPPKKKLDAAVVRDFEEWIRMGALDPRSGVKISSKDLDIEHGRKHWAYQPPKKVAEPKVKDTAWPHTDVDRFILAGLERKGLTAVGDTDRRTLLRRVTFDLTGLPPTPAEVEAFVTDASSDAFERVVDRLLASPRFGEKWARHWLDVARYAESTGKSSCRVAAHGDHENGVQGSYPHQWTSAASCGRTILVLNARGKVWPGQRRDHKTVAALWAST